MLTLLVSVFLGILGIVFALYSQKHLREEAQKKPRSLLAVVFNKIDSYLLSEGNIELDIENKVYSKVESIQKNTIDAEEIIKKEFDPYKNLNKISYSRYEVTINFLKSTEGKKSFKKLALFSLFFLVIVPTIITYLLSMLVTNNFANSITLSLLVFIIAFIAVLLMSLLDIGPLKYIFRLLTSGTTQLYFVGERLSIANPGWYRIGCFIDDNPKFYTQNSDGYIGLYISITREDSNKNYPIIVVPRLLAKNLVSEEKLILLSNNLNKIIASMYVKYS